MNVLKAPGHFATLAKFIFVEWKPLRMLTISTYRFNIK